MQSSQDVKMIQFSAPIELYQGVAGIQARAVIAQTGQVIKEKKLQLALKRRWRSCIVHVQGVGAGLEIQSPFFRPFCLPIMNSKWDW